MARLRRWLGSVLLVVIVLLGLVLWHSTRTNPVLREEDALFAARTHLAVPGDDPAVQQALLNAGLAPGAIFPSSRQALAIWPQNNSSLNVLAWKDGVLPLAAAAESLSSQVAALRLGHRNVTMRASCLARDRTTLECVVWGIGRNRRAAPMWFDANVEDVTTRLRSCPLWRVVQSQPWRMSAIVLLRCSDGLVLGAQWKIGMVTLGEFAWRQVVAFQAARVLRLDGTVAPPSVWREWSIETITEQLRYSQGSQTPVQGGAALESLVERAIRVHAGRMTDRSAAGALTLWYPRFVWQGTRILGSSAAHAAEAPGSREALAEYGVALTILGCDRPRDDHGHFWDPEDGRWVLLDMDRCSWRQMQRAHLSPWAPLLEQNTSRVSGLRAHLSRSSLCEQWAARMWIEEPQLSQRILPPRTGPPNPRVWPSEYVCAMDALKVVL